MKKIILLLFIISISLAQQTWIRTYGTYYDDWGISVQQTLDGGYIVAGLTYSFGAGDADIWIIKTDTSGDTLWTRTFGGASDDRGYSIQQALDGGYIITGSTYSFGAGSADVYLIKTNASGDTLWTRTSGGRHFDIGCSVQQTTDGGYIVAGGTFSVEDSLWGDVYLIKTNSSGETIWTRTYGRGDIDWGTSVQQTSDGDYIIAGYTYSLVNNSFDVYLIKTNASGDTLWTRTYGGTNDDRGSSVQQTLDGGYIIAGFTCSFGAGSNDIYLVKTNASGDTLWTRTYGGTNDDYGLYVQQTPDSGYILTGYTRSFGAGNCDVYLIKTNVQGDTVWTRTYGGTSHDYSYSVQQTSDGGYIIAGITDSLGNGYDVLLIKTDADGIAAVEERKKQSLEVRLQAVPNPFTSFARILGYENENFTLSDITGRMVGKYKGAKIGANLPAGVYFIIPQDKSLKPVRVVKIK